MARKSPARSISTNNLGGNTTSALTRSSIGDDFSSSMHAAIPRGGRGVRRSLTGDGLRTTTTTTTTTRPIRPSLRTQRDYLSSPAQSSSTLVSARMGVGKGRPSLSGTESTISIDSVEGVKSVSSTLGDMDTTFSDMHTTSSGKENSSLPKGMQERMKQRVTLRATGQSTRSLRSTVSETSSNKSSLHSRATSNGSSQRPSTNSLSTGKSVVHRPPAHVRSVSVSQLKVSSQANQRRISSGGGGGDKSWTSVHERNSPVSHDYQQQQTELQDQMVPVQKTRDQGSHDGNGKSMTQEEIRPAREDVLEDEEHDDVHESPPVSPKRNGDEIDTQSGTKDQVSMANTINSTGTHSSSTHRVTSSILGALLTIPSMAAYAESPVSSTSTRKMELLQSYRREQNSSTRSRKLEELRNFRRHRESQLLNMVHNRQDEQAHVNKQDETALDSTDVIAVIVNLRDELSAAQEVIEQQRTIMETMSSQVEEQKEIGDTPTSSDSTTCPPEMVPLTQYQELQLRFGQLQMDRAWGEFQLRDRITTDALKFHRRLRRWKDQTVELRCSIQNLENDHKQQLESLKQQNEHKRQGAERDFMELLEAVQATADEKFRVSQKEHDEQMTALQQKADEYLERSKRSEKELEDLKKSTQMAFDEFCDAKDRIEMLENEIVELKGGNDDDTIEPPREFPKKRLTRRSCKRDGLLDDDDKGESKGEDDAVATRYWGSWFHKSGAPSETKSKNETCSSSPIRETETEEEKVENEKQMLPSHPQLEGHELNRDESLSVDVTDTKATTWGTWGLPKIFSSDTEVSRQDHEMNLTD